MQPGLRKFLEWTDRRTGQRPGFRLTLSQSIESGVKVAESGI